MHVQRFLTILFCLFHFFSSAQKSELRSKADTLFLKKAYYQAISFYKNVVSADSQEICYCKKQLARCYDLAGDPSASTETYREVVRSCKTETKDLKDFARVLLKLGEYEKAKRLFASCYQADTSDFFSYSNMIFCDTVKQAIDRLTDAYVENLLEINSGYDDVVGEVNHDTVLFLSARKVRRADQKSPSNNQYPYHCFRWLPSGEVEELKPSQGYGFSCQDEEGSDLYFSQMDPVSHRSVIYRKRKKAQDQELHRFAFDDDSSSFGHPSLSTDGTLFFFVSDMPGGMGSTDIYFCRRQGTKWSRPINAGPTVNTADSELFPCYLGEGILVYSSNGKAGFGGFDLYASRLESDLFHGLYHLPWPINSRGEDLSFRTDKTKKTFYLSSTRAKGKGALDVYKIHHYTISDLKGIF